jgi:LuxR family maltose regulon positive regulatory protein
MPPLRAGAVARPRLIDRLDAGRAARLVLLSAPAGSGKTTLAAQWLGRADGPPAIVAWVSLDEADNDPIQFLRYLLAALPQAHASRGAQAQELSRAPQAPAFARDAGHAATGAPAPASGSAWPAGGALQALLVALVDEIDALGRELYLVLDDYHRITAPGIHGMVGTLVEHLPPAAHVVIATRADPPLPLPRLRARGQLTELRERDLRFTEDEAAAFLGGTLALSLPQRAVAALPARTEGWIAGLQLAALALEEDWEDAGSAEEFAAAFTGEDRHIIDYLMSEVLERQAGPARDFLLQTAILDRLTAGLCDAVTGRDDGAAMLQQLEAKNLFLVPLDHRREWYRYGRLFADFLRSRLDAAAAAPLHERAAAWCESHGLPGEAIRHALACAPRAAARQDAVRLIRAAAEGQFEGGTISALRVWLDALPAEAVLADGELATYRAWCSAMAGDFAGAERYAAAAEPAAAGLGAPARGRLLALQAILAVGRQDHAQVIELAQRALPLFDAHAGEGQAGEPGVPHPPATAPSPWRTVALWTLAEAQERTRPIDEAIASLRAIRAGALVAGERFFAPAIDSFLASALNNGGQRRAALAICEQALAGVERPARRRPQAAQQAREGQEGSGGEAPCAALPVGCTTEGAGRAPGAEGAPDRRSGAASPPLSAMVLAQQALLYWEGDEIELAGELAGRALAQAERIGFPELLGLALGHAALIAEASGDTSRALAALGRARSLAAPAAFSDSGWLRAWQANIHLRHGDREQAALWAAAEGLAPGAEPTFLSAEPLLVYTRLLLAEDRLPETRLTLARLEELVDSRRLRRYQITVHLLSAFAADRAGEKSAARDLVVAALKIAAPEGYLRRFLEEDRRILELLVPVRYVAPGFVDRLLARAGAEPVGPGRIPSPGLARPILLCEPLTERELEVLRLVAAGLANAEIARRLSIANGTVKRHTNSIYGKLGVESRTRAIARAEELGLL